MESIISSECCRICLKLCPDDSEAANNEHIHLLAGRITLRDDDLPQKICIDCENFLARIHAFYKVCENTELLLQSLTIKTEECFEDKEGIISEVLIPEPQLEAVKEQVEHKPKQRPKPKKNGKKSTKKKKEIVKKKNEARVTEIEAGDYDFEAFEKYLADNCESPGPLELQLLAFKTCQDRSNLPPNEDDNTYEFDQRYECDYCNETVMGRNISGIDTLNYHVTKYHSTLDIVNRHCGNCGAIFTSQVAFDYHQRTSPTCANGIKFSPKEMMTCSFCDYTKAYTKNGGESMRKHIFSQHSTMPNFQCPACTFVAGTIDQLRAHYSMRQHPKDLPLCRPLPCDFCAFSCCLEQNMQWHVNYCHATQIDQLPLCPCGVTQFCSELLLQHILFRCQVAEEHLRIPFKTLLIPRNVAVKKPTKSVLKQVQCPVCNLTIAQRVLTKHMVSHPSSDGGAYICDLCGRFYQKKLNLKLHMRKIHIQNLFFACKYCERKFHDWSAMSYHLKTTHDNSLLTHTCDICGKRYEGLHRLEEHRSVHTNERPHECYVCGLKFRHKRQLTIHRTVHSTERPLTCSVCNKSFKSNKALRQHALTHGNRAYRCPVCKVTFTVGHTLRNHIESRHPEFPMPPRGTPLRNVDLRKYVPTSDMSEFI